MRRTTPTIRRIAVAAVVATILALATSAMAPVGATDRPTPEAAPVLKADYRFANNLNSSVAGARPLTNTGAQGTNTFATENVEGVQRRVMRFPAGNGVQLSNASTVIPRDRYTIVVRVRFDDITSFTRVINFTKNASPDTGVYLAQGRFWYYPLDGGAYDSVADPDEWVDIAVTRGSGGLMRGFVDGIEVWEEAAPTAGLTNSANLIRFFRDNGSGVGETHSGAVSRIRLWNKPLTPAQVTALST